MFFEKFFVSRKKYDALLQRIKDLEQRIKPPKLFMPYTNAIDIPVFRGGVPVVPVVADKKIDRASSKFSLSEKGTRSLIGGFTSSRKKSKSTTKSATTKAMKATKRSNKKKKS